MNAKYSCSSCHEQSASKQPNVLSGPQVHVDTPAAGRSFEVQVALFMTTLNTASGEGLHLSADNWRRTSWCVMLLSEQRASTLSLNQEKTCTCSAGVPASCMSRLHSFKMSIYSDHSNEPAGATHASSLVSS